MIGGSSENWGPNSDLNLREVRAFIQAARAIGADDTPEDLYAVKRPPYEPDSLDDLSGIEVANMPSMKGVFLAYVERDPGVAKWYEGFSKLFSDYRKVQQIPDETERFHKSNITYLMLLDAGFKHPIGVLVFDRSYKAYDPKVHQITEEAFKPDCMPGDLSLKIRMRKITSKENGKVLAFDFRFSLG